MFTYFWKTLIALKSIFNKANNAFIANRIWNIAIQRREKKVRKVQIFIRENFLTRINDFKTIRCIRIIQSTNGPVYKFKEEAYRHKAKEVVAKFLRSASTGIRFKNSCLVYIMRTKMILNRFRSSSRIKQQYQAKLKPLVDKQIIKLAEYDNFLPPKERIDFSKKVYYYYKNEALLLEFVIDISKILLLGTIYNGEHHLFNSKRLQYKYYVKYPYMANIWKRYKKPNPEFDKYIKRYQEFSEVMANKETPKAGVFKTEARNGNPHDGGDLDCLSHLAKGNRIVAQVMEIDFRKLIFEFLTFKNFSLLIPN